MTRAVPARAEGGERSTFSVMYAGGERIWIGGRSTDAMRGYRECGSQPGREYIVPVRRCRILPAISGVFNDAFTAVIGRCRMLSERR